jgi:N-acetyltransferase
MNETFDRQPKLVGKTLVLRPLKRDDFGRLYAVANDPLLWEQHPEPNRHERPVFRGFFDPAQASGGALTVVECVDNRIVGSTRFHGYDPRGARNRDLAGHSWIEACGVARRTA